MRGRCQLGMPDLGYFQGNDCLHYMFNYEPFKLKHAKEPILLFLSMKSWSVGYRAVLSSSWMRKTR